MGSMVDVMKKAFGQTPAAAGDLPSPPPADAAASASMEAVDASPAAEDPGTGFIADPRAPLFDRGEGVRTAAKPPMRSEPGTETVPWRPERVDRAVVAFHDRLSSVCEQYRNVRARILSMNARDEPQVIAITSSIPQEGKSVSTLNLGLVMAEGGQHRIVIADADFRRRCLGRMVGDDAQPGLAELLRGEARLRDVLRPTPFPNLRLIPAGVAKDRNYAELIGRPSTRDVLAELRATFDYTFLDTPPVTTVSDVSLLAPACDGAIVVIEMRRTPEPTVHQAVRTLQTNNVRILGCILSRFRDRRSQYYDRYYSYYPAE